MAMLYVFGASPAICYDLVERRFVRFCSGSSVPVNRGHRSRPQQKAHATNKYQKTPRIRPTTMTLES